MKKITKKKPMMGKPIVKNEPYTSNGPKAGHKPRTARTVKGGKTMS